MNPLFVLAAVFAAACAAPAPGDYAAVAPAAVAPVAAVGYAAHAPAAVAVAAPAPAPVLPAPYTTSEVRGAPVTRIEQAPAVVTKQVHYGKTQFVSGYASKVHKPAIPRFNIAVPTVLKGSVAHNPAIVKTVKEPHVVNEPYPVERRVDVPYDVPVYKEHLVEQPVPVHVDQPYNVPYAVPVQGEPIVNVRRTQPIVQRTHEHRVAPAVVHHAGHVHTDVVAAPAVAAVGYAGHAAVAPVAAVGYAGHAAAVAPAVAKY